MKTPLRILRALFAAIAPLAITGTTAFADNYLVDPNYVGPSGAPYNGYTAAYNSVAAALAASGGVPSGASATNPNRIYFAPGTYNVGSSSLSYSASNVAFIGVTGNPGDVVITSYLDGAITGTTGSSSLQLKGSHTSAANITFANSTDTPYIVNVVHQALNADGTYTGPAQTTNAQCVAIKITGDQQAFQNCRFLGYQDTLYSSGGRAYFNNCYVSGDVDFIFGNGTLVFNHSQINLDGDHSGGTVTAASTDKRTSNGIVFLNSTITANSVKGDPVIDPYGAANASGAASGSMNLGRPWGWTQPGGDAGTVFINTKMAPAIKAAGWLAWDSTETFSLNGKNGGNPAEDTRYAEYNSTDLTGTAVDTSNRLSWSHQLTAAQAAAFTPQNLFSVESDYPWFGAGYSGSANPADPNFSWPAYWGIRNSQNETNNDTVTGNPVAYSDPGWAVPGSWDADGQLALAIVAVPEPATLFLFAAALTLPVFCRRRSAVFVSSST
ncbi:MAG TPA: pectinesterase family protein [Phycisphaerae bacterium]|nr:pectinesterase family protein [Phycisphaerae bacterium]